MGLKVFDKRLVEARKEKGLTQEELAVRLGVTPQAVSKWERGSGYPDVGLLCALCGILDCSLDYLLGVARKDTLMENEDEKARANLLKIILAEPLMLETGLGLVDLLFEEGKNKMAHIRNMREGFAGYFGILMPTIRIRDNTTLSERQYRIMVYDTVLFETTVAPEEEITFEDFCKQLERVVFENFGTIINRQTVQTLVDNVESKYPAVVKGVIPEKITLSLLQKVLIRLVENKRSIRNLIKIIEFLEDELDAAPDIKSDIEALTDKVMAKLI